MAAALVRVQTNWTNWKIIRFCLQVISLVMVTLASDVICTKSERHFQRREAEIHHFGDYDYSFRPPPSPPPALLRRKYYRHGHRHRRPRHNHRPHLPPPPPRFHKPWKSYYLPPPLPPPLLPAPSRPPPPPAGYVSHTPSARVSIEGAAPAAVPAIRGGYAASGRFIAENAGTVHIA